MKFKVRTRCCNLYRIAEGLKDSDKTKLFEALDFPPSLLPATDIAAELVANGHDVTERAVQRHRAGSCPCFKVDGVCADRRTT